MLGKEVAMDDKLSNLRTIRNVSSLLSLIFPRMSRDYKSNFCLF